MIKTTKAIYGNVSILKQYCPRCKSEAFIIDGTLQCCGRKVEDYGTSFKKKRETEGSLIRGGPSDGEKSKILEFQCGQCVYCGIRLGKHAQPAYDHFTCFASSGDNSYHNFVCACSKCNSIKGSLIFKSIQEARIYIIHRRETKGLPVYEYYGGSYDVEEQ